MSSITIRPVHTKRDTTRFIKFLWKVYAPYPAWVPPLLMDRRKLMDKKKNPFYQHAEAEFYIAERNGEMVGRIGAIVNHNHNKEHNERVGFFGFFESINDQEVANALFDTATSFAREHGATVLRGPANPSVNDEYGLLVDGFQHSPTVLMPYNPPYYGELIENYGFKKAKDLFSFLLSQDTVYSDKLERVHHLMLERHGITIRTLEMKRFRAEVELVKHIYNTAWAKNWGAVPMTDEEIDALAADLKPVVEPRLVLFAESKGKTIGFSLALPDINRALRHNNSGRLLPGLYYLFTRKKEIKIVRVIVLGVLPEFRHTGAAGILFYETAVRAKKLGYEGGEAGWVLEDNTPMIRAAEMMNGVPYKKYRIYDLPL
jgi:GNAT superfamily N-acetyltransferase